MIRELRLLAREWLAGQCWLWFLHLATPPLFNLCVSQVEGQRRKMNSGGVAMADRVARRRWK